MDVLTIDASKIIFQTPVAGMMVIENDKEAPWDGGRVLLTAEGAAASILYEQKITSVNVLLNHRKDEPMEKWPVVRADRERRRFRLIIVEDTE